MMRISSSSSESSDPRPAVRSRSRSPRPVRSSFGARFMTPLEDRSGPSRSRRSASRTPLATPASRALALTAAVSHLPSVRPSPVIRDEFRERSSPYCPWDMPPSAVSSPVFRPDPHDFMPGSVQFPLAMVSALPSHSWAIGSFHDAVSSLVYFSEFLLRLCLMFLSF